MAFRRIPVLLRDGRDGAVDGDDGGERMRRWSMRNDDGVLTMERWSTKRRC